MKTKRLSALLILLLLFGVKASCIFAEEVVNMQYIGEYNDHLEHFVPLDQPDVYYDNVAQSIIIDGGGVVTYYDVEIASATSFVTVISTQVNGYYDTIDISSLSTGEYFITIYSSGGNTFEGFFEVE